jgi:Cys-rich protein (TIGR01571 family)
LHLPSMYAYNVFRIRVGKLSERRLSHTPISSSYVYTLARSLTMVRFSCTVAAGQVINRLQFTWTGTPAQTAAQSARAFSILLYITLFHWILFWVLFFIAPTLDPNDYGKPMPPTGWIPPSGFYLKFLIFYDILKYVYFIIVCVLLVILRKSVRAKYGIQASEGEDVIASCCCPCLVAGQMLRHTTDYDLYPAQLCSATGLSSGAPSIV